MSLDEALNLFDAFHYYGKYNTLETAEEMMTSEVPLPLINHWTSFDEFLVVWDIFHRMTRKIPRTSFGKMLIYHQFPENIVLSREQQELLSDPKEFKRQACYLLSFFDSLSDYFEYEVQMIERGYPHKHRAA